MIHDTQTNTPSAVNNSTIDDDLAKVLQGALDQFGLTVPDHLPNNDEILSIGSGWFSQQHDAYYFGKNDGDSGSLLLSDCNSQVSELRTARHRALQAERIAREEVKHRQAALLARATLDKATTGKTPYSKRKGITVECLRVGKTIIVPMHDNITGELVNVQRILPNGDKLFGSNDPDCCNWQGADDRSDWNGGRIKGTHYCFGDITDSTLIVAEGFATGARLYQATGLSVVVLFNTGGIKKWIPPTTAKRVYIGVDNDSSLAGAEAAQTLIDRIGDSIEVIPLIPKAKPGLDKSTDWADYTEEECAEFWPLKINERYIPADCLKHGESIILKAGHGCGKSTAFRNVCADYIRDQKRIVIVAAGIAQARAEQKKINTVLAAEGMAERFELYSQLPDGEIVADHVIVVIDSIMRITGQYDLAIIDEVEQAVAAPLKHDLYGIKKNPHKRVHLFHHLASIVKRSEKVILCDADAGEKTESLLKHATKKPRHITNCFKSMDGSKVTVIESKGVWNRHREENKNDWHLFCASKQDSLAIKRQTTRECELVNGDDKNSAVIDCIASGIPFAGCMITTTSARSGLSVDEGKHDVKTVYALIQCGDNYPPLSDQIQAMRRFRGVKEFVVYVEQSDLKRARTTDPAKILDTLKRQREVGRAFAKAEELTTSTIDRGCHLDPFTTDIYCLDIAERNAQRNHPTQWLVNAFQELGADIVFNNSKDDELDQQYRETHQATKTAIKEDDQKRAQTIQIPESQEQCSNDVERDLYKASQKLDLPEPLARAAAKQAVKKRSFVDGISRRRYHTKPQQEIKQDDISGQATTDPTFKTKAGLAAMNLEVIGLCWELVSTGRWFTAKDTDAILKPSTGETRPRMRDGKPVTGKNGNQLYDPVLVDDGWLVINRDRYADHSRRELQAPVSIRSAGFLKKILEDYGIAVTSSKSEGVRRYRVLTESSGQTPVQDESAELSKLNQIGIDELSQSEVLQPITGAQGQTLNDTDGPDSDTF